MQNTPLSALLPDAFLMIVTVAVLLNDIITGKKGCRLTYMIVVGSSLIAAPWYAVISMNVHPHYYFSNMYVVDSFASLMKSFLLLGFAVSLIYSRKYLEERALFRGDFYLLALFSLLGQLVMVSGNNFLTLYLGLELMSLSSYAIIALRRELPQSNEAAIKYYVLGALASGFLLYGISMLYGATGSLDLHNVSTAITSNRINYAVLLFGVTFIVASIAFKMGGVPFHMWVPDVYHGAPTAMTLLISGIPKVAIFAWGWRFLVIGLLPLAIDWQAMLITLAALSLIVGNVTGIVQHNIKRMLAYSAISNTGFILLGLLSGVVGGQTNSATNAYGSTVFYGSMYLLTILGSFGIVMLLARRDFEADLLDDFKGLNKRSPVFAFVMLLMMFSLAGIPPTVGFYAKFAVLEAVVNAKLTWLAVLAVITSLFGAFYYLRIIKLMYFDEPVEATPITAYSANRALLVFNGFTVLLLGIIPGPLISVCMQAVRHTLPL
ncbi:NADH-quinone oxidoreductase subunit NuoN [Candidatus Vallotia cooleyia]|uniref:NADH-quinone oxidoreductase subunit NuoN n=1 Tax=Candidatus Vallotiella adelgis TaxID=1177211 RepID=UPI001D00C1D2|nr:NADH-quinone oxidoreductase subunit NuoN [Candidatus Vallotia cooleyia]UDG82376.1 NADH-quinone oxidoreductase subunit N [Candidatus Vallotia cooleyia]